MRIAVLESAPQIEPSYLSYLIEAWHELIFDTQQKVWIQAIIIRSSINADQTLIESYPDLKAILRVGVGTDNIDVNYATSKNIKIINTPWANADAVADLVVRAMLSLARYTYQEEHSISNRFIYLGNELSSQTIAIFGFGNIGKKVYQRLKAFWTTQFLIYDPYISAEQIESFEWCTKIQHTSEAMPVADTITLHLPLTPETRNFIWAPELKQAQTHLKIINAARGGIVDEHALKTFLENNKKAWAFFDVWTSEPDFDTTIKELMRLPNFILKPHIGAMTVEANKNMHRFDLGTL